MEGGTGKQKHFARLVAEGSTLADAYADAYETNGKRETIRREAVRVAHSPTVAPLIEAESRAIEARELPSRAPRRRFVLERLVREAESAPSDSARVRSLELLGKACGAFEDDPEADRGTDADSLLDSLRSKLASVLPAPIEVTPSSVTPECDGTPEDPAEPEGEGGNPL